MGSARPSRIRVLLVDDHQLLTDALKTLFAGEPDIEIVATAARVADVGDEEVPPCDVVLMDYLLPDGSGPDATRVVKERWPDAKVVFLSVLTDDLAVARAVRAGADGYLAKSVSGPALVEAIRAYHAERSAAAPTDAVTEPRARGELRLTVRELQVLRGLASGSSTRDLSISLGIAPNTVRTHVQSVISKLGAHSRLEAVAAARRNRIV